jgi:hypothetical protein
MAEGSRDYTEEWALGQYPEVCRSCDIVTAVIAQLMPEIQDIGRPAHERSFAAEILQHHAKRIERNCLKFILTTLVKEPTKTWYENEPCWTEREYKSGH